MQFIKVSVFRSSRARRVFTVFLLFAASAHLAADDTGAPQQQSQRQAQEADPTQDASHQWLWDILQ